MNMHGTGIENDRSWGLVTARAYDGILFAINPYSSVVCISSFDCQPAAAAKRDASLFICAKCITGILIHDESNIGIVGYAYCALLDIIDRNCISDLHRHFRIDSEKRRIVWCTVSPPT